MESFDHAFGSRSEVVAIDEPGGEAHAYGARVVALLRQDDRASYARLARDIDAHPSDVLDVQHEYGLFGGPDGAWFLDLIEAVRKPVVVSLHTVLPEPSTAHNAVARRICERADAVVVHSQTGKRLLADAYGVDPAKLHVVHHGVPRRSVPPERSAQSAVRIDRPHGRLDVRVDQSRQRFGIRHRGDAHDRRAPT